MQMLEARRSRRLFSIRVCVCESVHLKSCFLFYIYIYIHIFREVAWRVSKKVRCTRQSATLAEWAKTEATLFFSFPLHWRFGLVVWWLRGGFLFTRYKRHAFKILTPIQAVPGFGWCFGESKKLNGFLLARQATSHRGLNPFTEVQYREWLPRFGFARFGFDTFVFARSLIGNGGPCEGNGNQCYVSKYYSTLRRRKCISAARKSKLFSTSAVRKAHLHSSN